MNSPNKKLAWLALLSALSVQPSAFLDAAPLGTAFTYQGRLDQAGGPATGRYDFLFRLYDAPTDGNQIGSIVQANGVLVDGGLFMVTLDFGPEAFTGKERWMQISVQTNGAFRYQTLSPRQLVTPAPWAQFALESASAGASTFSTFAATAGGIAGSNLTASADGTLTLRARDLATESQNLTNFVGGHATREVSFSAHDTVGSDHELTVGADARLNIGKDFRLDAGGNYSLTASKNATLSFGQDFSLEADGDASLQLGQVAALVARDSFSVMSGDASIVLKKDGTLTLEGKDIALKGSGKLTAKGLDFSMTSDSPSGFRSTAAATSDGGVGVYGESAATNGIGVLGIATTAADDDVHAGVVAVADAGNKRIALFASCVTNHLLPAAAIPRPAAIAGYALANQDILQGYGKSHGLKFRVSDGGLVTATAFEGDGASLTGIGADALADNSLSTIKIMDGSVTNADLADNAVTSAKIADGTVGVADLSPALASNTFWRLDGNSATAGGTHFLGTRDNQPMEIRVNGNRALRIEPNGTSPNLIAGHPANLVFNGVAGATIGGGGNAGARQIVGGHYSTIGGGSSHTIQARDATIAGGTFNRIEGGADATVIAGGASNEVRSNCTHAVLTGGWDNEIQAGSPYAAIGGGALNVIQTGGYASTIGGGEHNTVGFGARTVFVGGGNQNTVSATQAALAGGYHNAICTNATDAFLGGGSNNTISNATAATLGGGHLNAILNSRQAVLVGGTQNQIQGGTETVLVGGSFNTIQSGDNTVIGGGRSNMVSSNASFATIPGGQDNLVQGQHAFAAGRRAKALHAGAFVWADSSPLFGFSSTTNNQFNVRATGGVRLVTGIDSAGNPNAGVSLDAGGTAWNTLSDRNAKKNLEPVDTRAIVDRLVQVPVQRWNYQWESDEAVPHLGPMAQDFKGAFYPGRDDTHISTLEFDGVALAAIQGLNQKLEDKSQRSEIRSQKLEARLQEKDAEIAELKQAVADLKQLVRQLSE